MTRRAKRRALSSLAVLFGAAVLVTIGCTGDLISPPPQCTGTQCSCEEDPLQPLCKGFNTRPDGGMLDMSDAMKVDANANDSGLTSDTGTPPDAESDASADAADDGG
jgi:hypothetical protein